MAKKIDRSTHGPGWGEVILGAALALVLGVVLGCVLLVLKPVVIAKDLPKEGERMRGVVYYVEGATGGNARQAQAKRKAFIEGQTVTLTEAEINALAGGPGASAAATPPGKAPDQTAPEKGKEKGKAEEKAAPAPGSDGMLVAGTPNVRIRGGIMQVGAPVTIAVAGLDQKVIVQARGKFVKEGDRFVFQEDELYLGSCPLHRLPFVSDFVYKKVLGEQAIPEDVKAAWHKLASVTIEDNALKLSMQ
ncbi:MAG TPA: hypothetical protein VM029_13280 [Opitutaceae bacterium]|nr:hypothetical protein [Opitutaceae bacterium]